MTEPALSNWSEPETTTFAEDWADQRDRLRRAKAEPNRYRAAAILDKFIELCWIDYQADDRIGPDVKRMIRDLADLADSLIAELDDGKDGAELFGIIISLADEI